jgi:phosphatidate cytidylyltransferase
MAYFIGKNFGKHKLSNISPKKTLEGSFANLIFGIIPFIILSFYLQKSIFLLVFLGVVVNVVSQISDLSESLIKRTFDCKDSGNLLAGHGGFFDRFDSLFFSAPVLYFMIFYLVSFK